MKVVRRAFPEGVVPLGEAFGIGQTPIDTPIPPELRTQESGSELAHFHACDSDLRWFDLYERHPDWKRIVTPESFSHPAKMSPRLCEAIFEHLESLQLINQDSTVCDFMSGTGTTNIIASMRGYRSVSVELESKFAHIQMKNREGVARFDGNEPEWRILQGDARNLSRMLNGGTAIMSPPYFGGYKMPTSGMGRPDRSAADHDKLRRSYVSIAQSPRNIEKLRLGIVSPPYETMRIASSDQQKDLMRTYGREWGKHAHTKKGWGLYSTTSHNIGNLPAITSPPYMNAISSSPVNLGNVRRALKRSGKGPDEIARLMRRYEGRPGDQANQMAQKHSGLRYSPSKENLGNQKPEDYLSAMLKVYHEAFLAGISPLVTVTKNPTRNGKLVRLDLLTADLLTRAGYELFDYHQPVFASVRKEEEASIEEGKTVTTPSIYGKMGFFKILQVQKGHGEVAQYEDVIFARIPS